MARQSPSSRTSSSSLPLGYVLGVVAALSLLGFLLRIVTH